MSNLTAAAIRLLSRREHSAAELAQKLADRRWPEDETPTPDDIEQLILSLQQEGLQSDERFAESYINMRFNKGYGPQRIDNELRERGVSESIRRKYLKARQNEWWSLMLQVREKKFGRTLPEDYADRSKQMRYLQYRGFSGEKILELLS